VLIPAWGNSKVQLPGLMKILAVVNGLYELKTFIKNTFFARKENG